MFTIESVVWAVLFLLGAGLIFGLLMYLINYVCGQFPVMEPFAKAARIVLVVMAVLVLIGFILSLMGHPIVRGPIGCISILTGGGMTVPFIR
ncbi:MAG TPA: hypothetical protein VMS08_00215 [Candidatus Saccharimonadia bacterium]|nr:hypothetical protein [Candidatus Saccharimonadia bacterium]